MPLTKSAAPIASGAMRDARDESTMASYTRLFCDGNGGRHRL
jgi:hypothetical protein